MSSTAIDQLLQITTPTQPGRESLRAENADGDRFRAHLERAADAKEVKPPTGSDDDLRAQVDEDEPLEAQTEQHETSTSQQEEPQATSESSEAGEQSDEAPYAEETSDEVTLTAAAVAHVATESAEISATAKQALSDVEAVETSTSDHQQQPNGQAAANSTEAAENTNAAATAASVVETEIDLLGEETEGEASDATKKSNSGSAGDQGSAKQKTTTTTNSLPTTSTGDGQTGSSETIAQQAATAQSQTTKAAESLAETETTERSAQRGASKPDVRSTVLANQDASASIGAELNNSTTHLSSSETNATPNAPSPSSGTEAAAIAERSLGSILNGKAGSQANSTSGREAAETPTIDRARFVQRVGGAIRTAQQRDGQIQLRLSPPELGTLRIQLTVNEGAITAQLETETAAARTVLLDNLPALRERLAEQNITIEKFDVDVGREGQQQADNPGAEERSQDNSPTQTSPAAKQANAQESTTTEDDSHLMKPATDSGLDVRI